MLESYSTAERYDDESIRERQARAELKKNFEDVAEVRSVLEKFNKLVYLQGVSLAGFDEEGFSGDGASLFTLVNVEKDGVIKTVLMKLGWGEFSYNVFRKGDKSRFSDYIPERRDGPDFRLVAQDELLKEMPIQIACVSQHDSYFANVDAIEKMAYDPVAYLRENALFVAEDGQVTPADRSLKNLDNPAVYGLPNYEFKTYSEQEMIEVLEELMTIYQEIIERKQQEYVNLPSDSVESR